MTTKLLKMRALEDESEEGGTIDLVGGSSSKDEQAEGTRVKLFLGKRRYFSGIAASTPLARLTYKLNAVNAFIPTKKTPLTPLAFRLNAVNPVIPEKNLCLQKI